MNRPLTQRGFSVTETAEGGGVRLTVVGELDIATAHVLGDALHRQLRAMRDVVLDLSQVEFMDASGIQVMLDGIGEVKQSGLRFGLAPELHPHVKRMLQLT